MGFSINTDLGACRMGKEPRSGQIQQQMKNNSLKGFWNIHLKIFIQGFVKVTCTVCLSFSSLFFDSLEAKSLLCYKQKSVTYFGLTSGDSQTAGV